MESPVQIFREKDEMRRLAPTCCVPSNSSIWPLGWHDYYGLNNSEEAWELGHHLANHTNMSPTIPIIITAVYSMVFVVGLVGNSLVMFVIISSGLKFYDEKYLLVSKYDGPMSTTAKQLQK